MSVRLSIIIKLIKLKNDLLQRIKDFNANRDQSVLPLKYKAMSESPFSFLRGTCHLFYQDLLKKYPFPVSPLTWICGDLHLENFGSYKGQNKLLYFDMNDFDEALLAPLLFELVRLLVSVEIKTVEINFLKKERDVLIALLIKQYRNTLIKTKASDIEKETATGLIKQLIDKVDQRKASSLVANRTNNKTRNSKLLVNDKLLVIEAEEKEQLINAFTTWFSTTHFKGYKVTDAGFRIAGTGSIGVKRYLFLLEKETNPEQKKMIDIKQVFSSCLLNFIKIKQPDWENDADRIVSIQEMMQHVSPAFLSSFSYENNWYVVKQIQPTSDKIAIVKAPGQNQKLIDYVGDLGIITASAQLRSSGRYKSSTADELKAFAQDESWVKVITDWSVEYAERVKKDHAVFYKAWKKGYFLN